MLRKLAKIILQACRSLAFKTEVQGHSTEFVQEGEIIKLEIPCEPFTMGAPLPLLLNEQADRLAENCPGLNIPRDGSSLVRIAKMPHWLHRLARKVAVKEDPFYSVAEMMFEEPQLDFRYVIGYSARNLFMDYAWLKLGDVYYDPIAELQGQQVKGHVYLPLFELDLATLNEEMSERNSGYAPCLDELIEWSNRQRHNLLANKNHTDRSGENS